MFFSSFPLIIFLGTHCAFTVPQFDQFLFLDFFQVYPCSNQPFHVGEDLWWRGGGGGNFLGTILKCLVKHYLSKSIPNLYKSEYLFQTIE